MALIPPVTRVFVPPSTEDATERRRAVEAAAVEREATRAAQRPDRLAAIATGPTLRDIEKAADCQCGCHPSPASLDLHDGGVRCVCQLTQADREAAWKGFAIEHAAEELQADQRRRDMFSATAFDLGVEAEVAVSMCPLVICGVASGRAFYLRERHGFYRVTIARDEMPLEDPWRSPPEVPSIDIAEGSDGEFGNDADYESVALRVAVGAVRQYLQIDACSHDVPTDADHRFCRRCGHALG